MAINTDETCNTWVNNNNKDSFYSWRLCKYPVKWKVIMSYGVKYVCERHMKQLQKSSSYINKKRYVNN